MTQEDEGEDELSDPFDDLESSGALDELFEIAGELEELLEQFVGEPEPHHHVREQTETEQLSMALRAWRAYRREGRAAVLQTAIDRWRALYGQPIGAAGDAAIIAELEQLECE